MNANQPHSIFADCVFGTDMQTEQQSDLYLAETRDFSPFPRGSFRDLRQDPHRLFYHPAVVREFLSQKALSLGGQSQTVALM
jgi:hypothetical protein